MQNTSEVLIGLVVGHKRDGRCQYDPQVKEELVRRSMRPGVSVAHIAMQHGVNANLLRVWIAKAQRQSVVQSRIDTPSVMASAQATKARATSPTFVPMRIQTPPMVPSHPDAIGMQMSGMQNLGLQVRLPNGVQIDLGQASVVQVTGVLQMLSALPCLR
jgi:transposase